MNFLTLPIPTFIQLLKFIFLKKQQKKIYNKRIDQKKKKEKKGK